jgi:hypothetical protein
MDFKVPKWPYNIPKFGTTASRGTTSRGTTCRGTTSRGMPARGTTSRGMPISWNDISRNFKNRHLVERCFLQFLQFFRDFFYNFSTIFYNSTIQ